MTPTPALFLHPGREKPVIQRHPWVFSGAIDEVEGDPTPGDLIDIHSSDGLFLARGYFNPQSQIQARILTWKREAIDPAWWESRLRRAISLRVEIGLDGQTDAYRLINAESDFLPGLIVDRYGEWLVMQALTLGIDQRKAEIAAQLLTMTGARGVYERSDVDVRGKEGLRASVGVLAGELPPDTVVIREGALKLEVDLLHGHKTGFYLDQRPNRLLLGAMVPQMGAAARILNLFSFTGGFGVHALYGGAARVINADSSGDALAAAERNLGINGFSSERADHMEADVFDLIRQLNTEGEQFDAVICDPPKFAHSAAQVDKAARGYKDLNLYSFRLLRPGGWLFTFSCSGAISPDLFQKIVFGALADSGRDGQIIAHLSAGADHPIALTFPEGEYLKGLLIRVT